LGASQLDAYISNLGIKEKPLSSRTTKDILMTEILSHLENYRDLLEIPQEYGHISEDDLINSLLHQLQVLVQCYKGERSYSLSLVFEGIDKFLITIVL